MNAKAKVEKTELNNKEIPRDGTTKKIDSDSAKANKEVVARPTAKAGKRSQKSLSEIAELEAKEERKQSAPDAEKPKVNVKPARTKLERASKKYREVSKKLDQTKSYSLKEALTLACQTTTTKFDSTVELHINLNVDPKQADQNIRDNIVLPSGTGKVIRVAVFTGPEDLEAAKKAGADIAMGEEFLQKLDKEELDFDVLIASPSFMPRLGKYARLLGPKGLMPNPKSGTVTNDVAKAVNDSRAGKVEYRVDATGIVHLGIGKVSFGDDKLLANAEVVIKSIKANKPASVKSVYLRSAFVTTTMGPSIRLSTTDL